MQARMANPVMTVPGLLPALQSVSALTNKSGVAKTTLYLITLRASQINGCGFCVDMHSRELKEAGERDERIWAVGAWRESTLFTEAERAALALTEAATRIADRPDPVSDEVWAEAARHYDEPKLATLVLNIAMINFWNRVNGPIRQPVGQVKGAA